MDNIISFENFSSTIRTHQDNEIKNPLTYRIHCNCGKYLGNIFLLPVNQIKYSFTCDLCNETYKIKRFIDGSGNHVLDINYDKDEL